MNNNIDKLIKEIQIILVNDTRVPIEVAKEINDKLKVIKVLAESPRRK